MRLFVIALFSVFLMPVESAESFGDESYGTVRCRTFLNLRQGPSTRSADIGDIPCGADIRVLGLSDEWAQIEYQGVEGYAHTDYLDLYLELQMAFGQSIPIEIERGSLSSQELPEILIARAEEYRQNQPTQTSQTSREEPIQTQVAQIEEEEPRRSEERQYEDIDDRLNYDFEIKPKSQLENYFACYDRNGQSHFDWDREYRMLQTIARVYEVPAHYLFCLFMTESNLVDSTVSHEGAQGIAQFMPAAVQTTRVYADAPSSRTLERCENQNSSYCNTIRRRQYLAELWKDAEADLQSNGFLNGDLGFDPNRRVDAMAMAAMYIHRTIYNLEVFYEQDFLGDYNFVIDAYNIASVAYNAGNGTVDRIFDQVGQNIPAALARVRELDSLNEAEGHFTGISYCVENDNALAPHSGTRRSWERRGELCEI